MRSLPNCHYVVNTTRKLHSLIPNAHFTNWSSYLDIFHGYNCSFTVSNSLVIHCECHFSHDTYPANASRSVAIVSSKHLACNSHIYQDIDVRIWVITTSAKEATNASETSFLKCLDTVDSALVEMLVLSTTLVIPWSFTISFTWCQMAVCNFYAICLASRP